jgi:hypothetical protein
MLSYFEVLIYFLFHFLLNYRPRNEIFDRIFGFTFHLTTVNGYTIAFKL